MSLCLLRVAEDPFLKIVSKIARLIIDEEPYRWVLQSTIRNNYEAELGRDIQKQLQPIVPDEEERKTFTNQILLQYRTLFLEKPAYEMENPEVIPFKQIQELVKRVLQKSSFGSRYLEKIYYLPFPEQKAAWVSRIEEFIERSFQIFNVYYFFPKEYGVNERSLLKTEEKFDLIIEGFSQLQRGESRMPEQYPQYESMGFYQAFTQESRNIIRDAMIYQGLSEENYKQYFVGKPDSNPYIELNYFYKIIKEATPAEADAIRSMYA